MTESKTESRSLQDLLRDALPFLRQGHIHVKLMDHGVDRSTPCERCEVANEIEAAIDRSSEITPAKGLVLVSRSFIEATPCPNRGCSDGMIVSTGPDPIFEPCQWCEEKSRILNGEVPLAL